MENDRNVLIVCVCVWGNNEMWWRWCWMENSGNVVLEEERGQHSLPSVERPSYLRSDFVNV